MRRGWTVVELLVVIGIIAILIALALPPLGSARRSVQRTRTLANTRTIAMAVHMYAADHGDTMPSVEVGRTYQLGCSIAFGQFGPWDASYVWPAFIESYLPWEQSRDVYLTPGASRVLPNGTILPCGWPTSYRYSMSFVARPEMWDGQPPTGDETFGSVRLSEVAFPSGKAMIWDGEMSFLRRPLMKRDVDIAEPVPIATADASARDRTPADATAPTPPRITSPLGTHRLHNTPMGVRGSDF